MTSAEAPRLQVGSVQLGPGRPAIIVPIVGCDATEIIAAARGIAATAADIVEWRVDHFDGWSDVAAVGELAQAIAAEIGTRPLLFTLRTADEGGQALPSVPEYCATIEAACRSEAVQLVDVEYRHAGAAAAIAAAKECGVQVVASNHDFARTPIKGAVLTRLVQMENSGADIAKIAVYARTEDDVITLLSAVAERRASAKIPIIAVAMGALGAVSRVAGYVFGSVATFASYGASASAPGQLDVGVVARMLSELHADVVTDPATPTY